ncbi:MULTISPECIES: tyrosine-type recombinase/integrase [unclassified Pseudoalteromonas]|uniref:tyrosine-type recombinase/integrase n=1 Tax=unclassified Pseudoalteromonas TaxID=194690 RepID=UPI0025B43B62|nr:MULTISPECIES: tyrosine-type recombinase/integrase [unclassified Pseudoalteromonas]MDN3380944.1 tyrosine-type recombinase/integrase [Pseudoalteromonas sp. APC 3893]MDN3389352.1 tyrosine-type recombinase/integrase [Pseudoalteromonas sp. APC 4017]
MTNNSVILGAGNGALTESIHHEQYDEVQRYFDDIFARLPHNTRRAYISTMKSFNQFCDVNGDPRFSHSFDGNLTSIKAYVTSMCESQLAYKTVKTRIALLSKMMAIGSLPNPIKDSEYLRDFIKLELREFDIYNRANQAPALRISDLAAINNDVVPDNLLDVRDLALINLMFDGLLRADEVARVQIKHLNFEQNKFLVEKSKADQSGKGSFRYASRTSLSYISDYINEANIGKEPEDKTSLTTGILFRPISPKGTSLLPYDESEKRTSNMKVLNYTTIFRALKRIAKKAGLELEISGHSARVGGAVSMYEANMSLAAIKKAGDWTSEAMPARYTEQANSDLDMSILAKKYVR